MRRETTEGFNDLRMDGHQLAARSRMVQHVAEEWNRLVVPEPDQLLEDRVPRRVAADQRVLEHRERLLGADLHDRADRFALHLRIRVVQHRRQLGQRLAAAEDAEQIDRRAADGRVRGVLELLDRLPARRAESEQQLAQVPDGAIVFFDGEGERQRAHDRRADRVAHPAERLDVRILDLPQVKHDVTNDLAAGELVQHRFGDGAQRGAPFVAALGDQHVQERLRRHDVAEQGAAFDLVGPNRRDRLPRHRVVLDAKEVVNQREIQLAHRAVADRGQPRLDAFRRIV